jgi:hypothetical protein
MNVYVIVNDLRQRNRWMIDNQTYLRYKHTKLQVHGNVQPFYKAVWTFVKVYSGT